MCNGSTTVFGAVCLGSNPGQATKQKRSRNESCGFFMPDTVSMEQRVKRAQCVDKAKTSSLAFWIGVTL